MIGKISRLLMEKSKKQWDDIGSPNIGDIVYIADRHKRREKFNRKVYCLPYNNMNCTGRFIEIKKLVLIVGKSEFDNRVLINVLDGDPKIYVVDLDLIDMNGIRWQQHECHFKYRIIQRK